LLVLITGTSPNSIGEATAVALASSPIPPAKIILAGRSETKIGPVADKIRAANDKIGVMIIPLDLGSRTSIVSAARSILQNDEIEKVDVLINNAGIMGCPYTPIDCFGNGETILESQFVVNYLGVFLFTNLIISKI
jgi:NADP-dependent 3-hydroxy acid dehydrogenase YdfG